MTIPALTIAENALSEIVTAATFARQAKKLIVDHPKESIRIETEDAEVKAIIDEAFKARREFEEDTVFRGLYIQIGGIFEEFLRNIMVFALTRLEDQTPKYLELPEKVRNQNIYITGRAFCQIYEGISGRKIDFEELAKNIGGCFVGNGDFKLNKHAFTLFVGNCTPDHIEKLLESVGIGDIWNRLAKDKGIRAALGTAKTTETRKEILETISTYVKTRNGITHRGELSRSIDYGELIDLARFYESLANGLVLVCVEQLED